MYASSENVECIPLADDR